MRYQILLKPLQPFFFGGEHGFAKDEGYDRYYSKSESFPQQTHLLGMLRKTVMFNESMLKAYPKGDFVPKVSRGRAKTIVGERFNLGKDIDLGKIVSISPLFLDDGERLYMQAPLDIGLELRKREGRSCYNGKEGTPYILYQNSCKPFTAKSYLYDGFLSHDGKLVKKEKFFVKCIQDGNKKHYSGGTNDEAYYKRQAYIFGPKDLKFSFFVELGDMIKPIPKTIVTLGADKSKFTLSMRESTKIESGELFRGAISKSYQHKVVLTGDTLLSEETLKFSSFYLAYKQPFRYKAEYTFKRSERVYLAKRGSVFYFDSLEIATKFVEKIDSFKDYKTIGYNHCILIRGENHV